MRKKMCVCLLTFWGTKTFMPFLRSSYKSLEEQGFIIEISADCLPKTVQVDGFTLVVHFFLFLTKQCVRDCHTEYCYCLTMKFWVGIFEEQNRGLTTFREPRNSSF
jgi:hypothetical protein